MEMVKLLHKPTGRKLVIGLKHASALVNRNIGYEQIDLVPEPLPEVEKKVAKKKTAKKAAVNKEEE